SSSASSLKRAGAFLSELSMRSATSAMLRAGRVPVPPKMTSSISPPRIRLADVSPITQRRASTRFDLPQPFGPTIPVNPGSIRSSVGSTKDLKPERRSRVKRMRSGFRGGFEDLAEALVGLGAYDLLAVDEESRGRVDPELFLGLEPDGDDLIGELLVRDAGGRLVLRHAPELREPDEVPNRIALGPGV